MKILTVNEYLKNTYGKKMYKLALSCSDTCPNRDGTKGARGCIFCPNGASDGFAQRFDMPVSHQIENAKRLYSVFSDIYKHIRADGQIKAVFF